MDAVEFLKAKIRMCSNMDNCTSCGLYKEHTDCDTRCFTYPDEAVAAVEKWAKEHPVKTRQSEFLKNYPYAYKLDTIQICPSMVDYDLFESGTYNCRSAKFEHSEVCHECMRNYWLKEMEEEICEKPQK